MSSWRVPRVRETRPWAALCNAFGVANPKPHTRYPKPCEQGCTLLDPCTLAPLLLRIPKIPRRRIDGSEGENTLCSSDNSIHAQLFTYVDMLMDEPLVEMISPRLPPRPGPCGPDPASSMSFDSGRQRRITFIGRRAFVFSNPKPYGDCDATFRRLDVGKRSPTRGGFLGASPRALSFEQ